MSSAISIAEIEERVSSFASALAVTGGVQGLYLSPNLPESPLKRATSHFANYDAITERPVLLLDTLPFIFAEGIVLTNEHLFYRYRNTGVVTLSRVEQIDLRSSQLLVNGEPCLIIRDHTDYEEVALGVFLRRAIVDRVNIEPTDILSEFLARNGGQLLPHETPIEATDLFLLTNERLISLHSKWSVRYNEIIDVYIDSPGAVHAHPVHGHPLVSIGIYALKFIIDRSNANDCCLQFHVRGRNILTVKDRSGREAHLSRKRAEETRALINAHRKWVPS